MDLSQKSLGNPWTIPSQCFVCGAIMGVKGWNKQGKRVTCYACHCSFEIPLDQIWEFIDSPKSKSSFPEISGYS